MLLPHAKQEAFGQCRARFSAAYCASQSGKTIGAAPKVVSRMVKTMVRTPDPIFWLAAPTFDMAKEAQRHLIAALEAAEVWFKPKNWGGSTGVWGEFHLAIERDDGLRAKAVLEQRSGEHPERLVARAVHGIWVNEGARFKDEAWSGQMASRLIATQGWGVFDSSPYGENWFYREIYLQGLLKGHPDIPADMEADATPLCSPKRQVCVHCWAARDNPSVPPEEVERARKRLPRWAFAREWEGDPHLFAGQLFPHWNDNVNVARVEVADWPEVELAVDWGFGAGHPFALLMIGIDRARRRIGIAREHVAEGMHLDQQLRLIGEWTADEPRIRRITGDSASPGMLAAARARRVGRHVDVIPSEKGPGSVYDGTVAQADMIGLGDYIVDPRCVTTIRQHKGARWKPKRAGDPTGETTEEPLRKDEDTVAAARYCIWPRLGRAARKPTRVDR